VHLDWDSLALHSATYLPVSGLKPSQNQLRTSCARLSAAAAAADLVPGSPVAEREADVAATIGALDAGGLETGWDEVDAGADPNLCPSPSNLLDVHPMLSYADQQMCESRSELRLLAVPRLFIWQSPQLLQSCCI
jgi:hypothetical protein